MKYNLRFHSHFPHFSITFLKRVTLQLNVSNLFRIFTVNLNHQTLLQLFNNSHLFSRSSFFLLHPNIIRILRLECFCRNLEIGHRRREKDAQERWQVTYRSYYYDWITFATTKVALDLEAEPTYSFVAGLLDG